MDFNTIIVVAVALIAIAMAVILPIIYQKYSMNYSGVFKTMEMLLDITQNFTSPLNFEKKILINIIIGITKQSVEYAEQLYQSKQIEKEERKAYAIAYVHNMLTAMEAKIENQELLDSIISNVIEAAVLNLPKSK